MAFTFKHGDRPLEGYVIQRGVGRGGFGEVYYAVSDGGREVALKYLRDNPAIELRGVSHCMNLKSPHLVTIFDVKQNTDGEYFVIMEYVQGPSLRDLLIAEPDGLGPQKAAFFIRELAKGLGYLHDRGIVHRDMKPGNVFYEDGYVKIGDYGLSKFISVSRHSAQTASIGTVHYMAPEIGSGNYHRGIDIYALGVVLYEMLLGRVPYDGATMGEVLMKHLTTQPEVDDLPEPFGRVIRKALAKDPNERYQTVEEMAEDILEVGEIKDSLVGFNPQSLSMAARAIHEPVHTPMPSPNPPPQVPNVRIASARIVNLPRRLGGRFNRVGDKVTRRMYQLERKHGRRDRHGRQHAPRRGQSMDRNRGRHQIVAMLLVVGIATGMGLLTALLSGGEEALAIGAGFGVALMSAGVVTSRKVTFWLGQSAQPMWVQRLATLGCCGPLLAMAMAPIMDEYRGGTGMLFALVVTAMFVDWEKRMEHGASGEMKAGQAFSAGLCALIFTSIFADGGDYLMFTAAGVAAATSFAVQAVAWFVPMRGVYAPGRVPRKGDDGPRDPSASPISPDHPADGRVEGVRRRLADAVSRIGAVGERIGHHFDGDIDPVGDEVPNGAGGIPLAIPVERDSLRARLASASPLPPLRHSAARAFWSVAGFILLAGAVVSCLSTVLVTEVRTCPDTRQGLLTVSVACCGLLAFALRKTSLRRRPRFWQETLRPLLLSLTVIGVGASLMPMFVQPYLCDEARLGSFSGLILSGVLLLLLLFVARGRTPESPPFLMEASGAGTDRPAANAIEDEGEPVNDDEGSMVEAPLP